MQLIPKNWDKFQHYKDRCPPWIKLHKDLLNDRSFMSLPLASKALAPLLWLLASESKDGSFDASVEELEFRLRVSPRDITAGLKSLMDNGFFVDASTMLAVSYRDAIPETETEGERETETEREIETETLFEKFWKAYPKKVGKQAALKIWNRCRITESKLEEIIAALAWQISSEQWRKNAGQYIPNPATYINQGRWDDEKPQRVGEFDHINYGESGSL